MSKVCEDRQGLQINVWDRAVTLFLLYSFAEEALGVCQSLDGNAKRNRLTGSSGSLFSPFYPAPYPTNSSCIWVISVPANKRVKLIFDKIEIDRKDHVQVLDGRKSWSKELAVYHGYNLFSTGSAVYSTRKYMRIQFHSYQGSSDYAGFKAHFEAVDPRKYIIILFINMQLIFKA